MTTYRLLIVCVGGKGGREFRSSITSGTKVVLLLRVLQPGQQSQHTVENHSNAGNRTWEGS